MSSKQVRFSAFFILTSTVPAGACLSLLADYVRACGHDMDAAAMLQIFLETFNDPRTAPEGCPAFDAPFERLVRATAWVPWAPVGYPLCGDWSCDDYADWSAADPLTDPAVYAGVVAEMRLLDRASDHGRIVSGVWAEALRARRDHQAGGRPLWAIDIRPARPSHAAALPERGVAALLGGCASKPAPAVSE